MSSSSSSLSLTVERVSYAWSPALPLLEAVDLHLTPGWTGLVGANGTGKSTLLRLLSGALPPDAGRIGSAPAGLRIHLCPQETHVCDPDVGLFGEAWDRDAVRLRARLGLEPEARLRWPTLSPGERKRWQLGAALWSMPDVLLLDEPTNHLDAAGRAQLLSVLHAFSGIGVVVSHDRALLDALTTRTVRLERGQATLWSGAHAQARAAWTEATATARAAHASLRSQQQALAGRVQHQQERQQVAENQRSTRARRRNAGDNEARSSLSKLKAARGAARQAHGAALLRRSLERVEDALETHTLHREKGAAVWVDFQPAPHAHLLSREADHLAVGGRTLLRAGARCVWSRDSRVHLHGPNGAGKSTLLRALWESAPQRHERLLYLPQQPDPQEGTRLLAALHSLSGEARAAQMTLLGSLGLDPARLLRAAHPSPGETRKLMLADALGRQVWGLLLDEPTNHLDLPSIERLEETLHGYPGALLLVTHDEGLAARCTDTRWLIAEACLHILSTGEGVAGAKK